MLECSEEMILWQDPMQPVVSSLSLDQVIGGDGYVSQWYNALCAGEDERSGFYMSVKSMLTATID